MPAAPKHKDPALLGPIVHADRLDVGVTFIVDARARAQLEAREVNVKEAFTLVDALGRHLRASLKSPSEAVVYEAMSAPTESPLRVTLLVAVLGRQRMIPVVQKATELGCVRIVPVLSAHAVPRAELEKEKPWAWAGQALRAARQCRRAAIPEVLGTTRLADALAAPYFRGADARFVMDDRGGARGDLGAGLASRGGARRSLAVAVGPEGGWSEKERALFAEHGARVLALGVRVLRAETAVFAALSVLQHRFGDLG
jgi:16S rRNA (uracil1498-N3)-methyltransferase